MLNRKQFDLPIRILSIARSRRGFSTALFSGGLATLALSLAEENMNARKKKKKKKKKNVVAPPPPPDPCGAVTCGAVPHGNTTCQSGACAITSCDTGFGDCNGQLEDGCETNVKNSVQHCGACGHACPGQPSPDEFVRCTAGRCELEQRFDFPGTFFFTVPAAGTLAVDAFGAEGGSGGSGKNGSANLGGSGGPPGLGGRVRASFTVSAGELLQINVGGAGGNGQPCVGTTPGGGGPGGFNGGASGAVGLDVAGLDGGGGGGGGGASDVRRGAFASPDRVLAAGGGGGGGGGAGAAGSLVGTGGGGGIGGGNPAGGFGGQGALNGGDDGEQGDPGSGFGPSGTQIDDGVRSGDGRIILIFTAT